MRVYLAGGVTGLPDFQQHFDAAEKRWRDAGHEPINPTKICGHIPDLEKRFPDPAELWRHCMRLDIFAVMNMADAIALLPTHFDSRGANWELMTALFLGLPTYDAESMEKITIGVRYKVLPSHVGIQRAETQTAPVDARFPPMQEWRQGSSDYKRGQLSG